MQALKQNKGYIPYRDHKLTRLLGDSLGGACKTLFIINIQVTKSHWPETFQSLKYGQCVKDIENKIVVDAEKVPLATISAEEFKKFQFQCNGKIADLERQVQEKTKQIENLALQNSQLVARNAELERLMKKTAEDHLRIATFVTQSTPIKFMQQQQEEEQMQQQLNVDSNTQQMQHPQQEPEKKQIAQNNNIQKLLPKPFISPLFSSTNNHQDPNNNNSSSNIPYAEKRPLQSIQKAWTQSKPFSPLVSALSNKKLQQQPSSLNTSNETTTPMSSKRTRTENQNINNLNPQSPAMEVRESLAPSHTSKSQITLEEIVPDFSPWKKQKILN